jgi:hypothetical protein
MIANIPDHPGAMYVSQPVHVLPTKLVKDTVYMTSAMAERLLGNRSLGLSVDRSQGETSPSHLATDGPIDR